MPDPLTAGPDETRKMLTQAKDERDAALHQVEVEKRKTADLANKAAAHRDSRKELQGLRALMVAVHEHIVHAVRRNDRGEIEAVGSATISKHDVEMALPAGIPALILAKLNTARAAAASAPAHVPGPTGEEHAEIVRAHGHDVSLLRDITIALYGNPGPGSGNTPVEEIESLVARAESAELELGHAREALHRAAEASRPTRKRKARKKTSKRKVQRRSSQGASR